jgi:aminoglycoside phosphotransferase (APT) family kinase protein
LCAAFPGQIRYIEWPVDPVVLGRIAVETVRSALPPGDSAARAYVEKATQTLRELHSL